MKIQIPKAIFEELMKPLVEGKLPAMERGFMNTIKPTSYTQRLLKYNYVLNKGSLSEVLFHLEDFDKRPPQKKRKGKQRVAQYKRGLGCSRLHLSQAASNRGEKAALTMAMFCGAVLDYS